MSESFVPTFGGGIEPSDASSGFDTADIFAPVGTGAGTGDSAGGLGSDGFDPTIHIGRDKLNADGSYRRKRGRKSGGSSTGPRTKANSAASVESLTRMLAIVHIGIASATKTPELRLEEDEAEALSKATANVLEQFDIRPDPKIEAVIGLVMVAGSIYGPRVYMIGERKKAERQARED